MRQLFNRQTGGVFTSLAFACLLISPARLPAQSLIETNAAPPLLEKGRLAGGGAVATRALANQANDPTAPLTLIQFSDILSPTVPGQNSPANLFQIQPVMPVFPSRLLPFEQLLKMTMTFSTKANPGSQSGLAIFRFLIWRASSSPGADGGLDRRWFFPPPPPPR